MAARDVPSTLARSGPFPWIVLERVGAGATSVVFRATHVTRSVTAALKVATCVGPLRGEATLLARLPRRWGPALLDAGTLPDDAVGAARGASFLATEWVEGTALVPGELTGSRERAAALIAHGVGRGLAELHEAGVRHGDVKPANIVLSGTEPTRDAAAERGATLIDLGLADASLDAPLRGGTPRYLAPELLADGGVPGPESDLYALGLVLAEVLDPSLGEVDDLPAALSRWQPPRDSEPARWARALVCPSPGARPSASWLAERAARHLGLAPDDADEVGRRVLRIKRVYLALRATDLATRSHVGEGVQGPPRDWLQQAFDASRRLGRDGVSFHGAIEPLGALGIARWLVGLVGPVAAAWAPALGELDEGALAARLLDLAEARPPHAFTLDDLLRGSTAPAEPVVFGEGAERLTRLALELGRGRPSPATLAALEDDVAKGVAPRALALALAQHLLRAGEIGRAWACVAELDGDDALVVRAEVARRRADTSLARALAVAAAASSRPVVRDRAKALLSRLAWDAGRYDEAEAHLEGAAGAFACEARALLAYARGRHEDGLALVEDGLASCADDESRGRLEGMRGLLLHAMARPEDSVVAFARAAELAARAGAVLEEASYLTGHASAASDAGDLSTCLASGRRAALLWERLGRPREAARAWLAVAAAYATVGARHAADEAAEQAERYGREGGDVRARAYACWAQVEVREPGDFEAHGLAVRAWDLLASAADEDRVRAGARVLVWAPGVLGPEAITRLDGLARASSAGARLDWLGARAYALAETTPRNDDGVLAALLASIDAPAPLASKGFALATGARLAAELGDGDAARRLEAGRAEVAAKLHAGTPPELRAALAHVRWARLSPVTAGAVTFEPAQVERLTAIVRALGERESVKSLLAQVLDTLVLWTGVERGLLLLRAPDGRLVPRAARNLAKGDLRGEQLALSRTLAQRALETREPVVATDALATFGDLHASVHALRLRSVLAVPLLARGDALGVVYLDDRTRRAAFGPAEIAWAQVIGAQAATAIADARDQVFLRRAVRRAERLAARLETRLATQGAKLDATRAELERRTEGRDTRFSYDAIIGRSEAMRHLLRLVDRVTTADVPVLLIGESGTGKELVARAIHENGPRASGTFVGENCAAVPEPLLESTLFGHVRGAFTGATSTRAGLFDVADGGTLFLDEIGEMSLPMQAKLLRVLQDGEVRPVGGERTHKVNVRVIGATHRDLAAMVKAGTFREDLYYRLHVVTVVVPPLRDRREDIPLLVAHFLEKHCGGRRVRVGRAAMDRLLAFPWPGNIRQLENEIRRAVILADDRIDVEHLSDEVTRSLTGAVKAQGLDLRSRLDAFEADLVREALRSTGGNQTKAAALLGVSRFGLQKMIKRLNVRTPA